MGDSKAESLARRIRALSDDIEIEIHVGMLPSTLAEVATTTDVLIDATISHAVAQVVDVIAATPQRIVTIAQVATDTRSGTLGIATISTPSTTDGVTTIDRRAGDTVRVDPELEAYHVFWAEPLSGDEFVPTRGCSVPTFHGSAADIAGVAAALTSFVGQNPRADVSGTHLLAPAVRRSPRASLCAPSFDQRGNRRGHVVVSRRASRSLVRDRMRTRCRPRTHPTVVLQMIAGRQMLGHRVLAE